MYIFPIFLFFLFMFIFYDKFIQRKHQLLINYPVIGRMRYLFEELREPFRQYFANENFYESRDKVDWVYNASHNKTNYTSFSPQQPASRPRFMLIHSNAPYNMNEIDKNISITFGKNREIPYVSKSIIGRSAMSDGSISPEGTWAFTKGSLEGNFPINTGEGSLTTNFFITHKAYNTDYMEIKKISSFDLMVYRLLSKISNTNSALNSLKDHTLLKEENETYLFDLDKEHFYRPNWNAPLEKFPKTVPLDMPDITFQMSSGLFGVRDKKGEFDPIRYQKVMSFCKMTEIKLAQGAKQTGGKLTASKVTHAIAYYRGIEAGKAVSSPNRFPYANSITELFDFIAKLQTLSQKPVGIKIVISDKNSIKPFAKEMQRRKEQNIKGIPDFITIDGGDGGSATAPLALMERVGLHIKDAIMMTQEVLKHYKVREEIKLIASSKILTPDDAIIALALGADFINIARGFMMSAGCIRARMCSGAGSHKCPIGLATQDKSLRSAYLVYKNALNVASYHNNMIAEIQIILAVMGIKNVNDLSPKHLYFIDKDGRIYDDVHRYFQEKFV